VLDLSGLSFMDYSVLRVLINAQASASETGQRLDVVGARDQVKRLLALNGGGRQLELSAQPAMSVLGDDTNSGVVTSSILASPVLPSQTRGSGLHRASQP